MDVKVVVAKCEALAGETSERLPLRAIMAAQSKLARAVQAISFCPIWSLLDIAINTAGGKTFG